MFPTHLAQLERVANAAEPLEATEEEYSLDKLVSHSGLDRSAVLQVLKNYWIEADELDIVFLNLNPAEEHLLYGDR
ncbi:MAG: hypothetical protein ACFB4J_06630 [Elainellaceae cyanobacterium]